MLSNFVAVGYCSSIKVSWRGGGGGLGGGDVTSPKWDTCDAIMRIYL